MGAAQNQYNPGFDYSGLGLGVAKGVQQFGQSVSRGSQQPTPQFGSTNFQQYTIPSNAQSAAALIPTNQNPEQQIMQIIQRLLGGG